MKHNLLIVSNDYDYGKEIASNLADYFSMRVFDELEQLTFDFSPTSIDELEKQFGREFVYKKLSKILLSQCEFENVVFLSHYETLFCSKQNFDLLKENDFIILLNCKNHNASDVYLDSELFKKTINDGIFDDFRQNFADFALFVNDKEGESVFAKIVSGIKNYYGL